MTPVYRPAGRADDQPSGGRRQRRAMKSRDAKVLLDAAKLLASILHLAKDYMFLEVRLISPSGGARQKYLEIGMLRAQRFDISALEFAGHRANVYYGVVQRIRRQGTADACGSATAVWGDFDGGAPTALPIPPSIVVETSPSKYQALWLLDAPSDDLALVEAINRAIATLYGADRNACDRARVLRLPGFRNLKYVDRPYSRLRVCLPEQRFTIEELERAFPSQSTPAAPVRRGDVPPSEAPSWLPLVYEAILDELAARGSGIQNLNNGGVMVRCPLHNDRDPSLSIHPTRGWKCFAGCGEGKLTMLAYKLGVAIK